MNARGNNIFDMSFGLFIGDQDTQNNFFKGIMAGMMQWPKVTQGDGRRVHLCQCWNPFLCFFNLAILLSFSGEHLAGCSGEIKLICIVPLYRKNTFGGAHLIIIDLPGQRIKIYTAAKSGVR